MECIEIIVFFKKTLSTVLIVSFHLACFASRTFFWKVLGLEKSIAIFWVVNFPKMVAIASNLGSALSLSKGSKNNLVCFLPSRVTRVCLPVMVEGYT